MTLRPSLKAEALELCLPLGEAATGQVIRWAPVIKQPRPNPFRHDRRINMQQLTRWILQRTLSEQNTNHSENSPLR